MIRFLQNIIREFEDLRLAVERHISKMKGFAHDLEKSSCRFEPLNNELTGAPGVGKAPKVSAAPKDVQPCTVCKIQRTEIAIEPSTSNANWHNQFDDIEVSSLCSIYFIHGELGSLLWVHLSFLKSKYCTSYFL